MSSRIAAEVLAQLHSQGGKRRSSELPFYSDALQLCLIEHPPIYDTQKFVNEHKRFAINPSRFASLLVTDADLEGYSASQLWTYSSRVEDQEFAQGMQRHARDEARHSRMFGNLLLSLFPSLRADTDLREKMAAMAPSFTTPQGHTSGVTSSPFEEVLNTAILVNLHEVKALRLEHMLRPIALAYSSPEQAHKVEQLILALTHDEVNHIGYTAEFIEVSSQHGYSNYIRDAMLEFQSMLNRTTFDELENMNMLSL